MRIPIYYRAWALTMALMLSACAQMGGQPLTFNERLAVAYATVTATRDTATQLLAARKIGSDDGQNVLVSTDAARAGLDVARTLGKIDPLAADAKLTAVSTTLNALRTYLATKGGS